MRINAFGLNRPLRDRNPLSLLATILRLWIVGSLLVAGCSDQPTTPVEAPKEGEGGPGRQLRGAFIGETAVKILINGNNLTDPGQAERLRVDMVIDTGRPTFAGNNNNKTVKISPTHTQASIVEECTGQGTCEGNVFYDDLWGTVTTGPERGTIADGDYTVKLFRDGSTLVGSKAIAVNHTNSGGSNGTFLDEASDQTVTFYLNSSLNQISAPTVSKQHTRASTHLSAKIDQPSAADTTITVGQSLTVIGSASNGVGGTKKYAWDWNASGGNQETFDTEFSSSTSASHTYTSTGDFKIRLIARDGNDNDLVAPPWWTLCRFDDENGAR